MRLSREKVYMEMAAKNWAVTEFCNELGVSRQTFNTFFRSKANHIKTVTRLAYALNVEPSAIIFQSVEGHEQD